MRAFLALVAFEICERKALLIAAAVASVLPLLAPILATTRTNPPADIREVAMWVMVLGLVPLFALLLGVSFIGRDLAEDRLGFYFAQPLSGPTIWFGKLTAVVLLLWSAQVIIMLPTVLLASDRFHLIAPDGPFGPNDPLWLAALPMWFGSIGVLLLAHAVGTIWRARSVWVIMDLLGFLGVTAVAWVLLLPFFYHFTAGVVKVGLLWLVWVFFGGLLVAGAIQLTVGRVDSRRGHRALSVTLWSILIFGVAALGGWTWWVRAGSPRSLSAARQVAVGAGDWIAVKGPSPGRVDFQPRIIMNVSDGRWLRAHANDLWDMNDVVFAKDGSRAAWLSPINFAASKLIVADLEVDNPEGRESGLDFEFAGDMALSDDGDQLALIQGSTVMVFDLDTEAQLTAVQIGDDFNPIRISFENRDRVRIESVERDKKGTMRTRFQTRYLDIPGKSLSEGDEPRINYQKMTVPRCDGSSLVSFYDLRDGEKRMVLVDESTGEPVAELGKMPNWSNLRVVGDRLVVFRWEEGGAQIEIFDGYGEIHHRIDVDGVGAIYVGGNVAKDRILAGLWNWGSDEDASLSLRTIDVNVVTGRIKELLDGFAPVIGVWGTGISPGAWDTGSTAGRIFSGEDHSLHLWDPETNDLKQLIPVTD